MLADAMGVFETPKKEELDESEVEGNIFRTR
jgi:hypothetical protein